MRSLCLSKFISKNKQIIKKSQQHRTTFLFTKTKFPPPKIRLSLLITTRSVRIYHVFTTCARKFAFRKHLCSMRLESRGLFVCDARSPLSRLNLLSRLGSLLFNVFQYPTRILPHKQCDGPLLRGHQGRKVD